MPARVERSAYIIVLALLFASTSACAQNSQASSARETAPPEPDNRLEATGKKAGEIVTQPVRDVGVSKKEIPAILAKAQADPYGLADLRTCKLLSAEIIALNEVLGPDFVAGLEKRENRAGKIAEAGGKTVINAFIPFRGLVREISGAAPAQRRMNDAIDAGFARRGFLRGIHQQRGCRTGFEPVVQQNPKK